MNQQREQVTARLALSSGSVFSGCPFGAVGKGILSTGEVVFNTSMTGYQESLTDPSYMGQILIQTQPMIGNTGVNLQDIESDKVQVSGFVIHQYTEQWSNYRAHQSLDQYLASAGVLGISEIDTRSLTRNLRSQGVVQGVITDRTDISDSDLVELAKKVDSMSGQNLASKAGATESKPWTENLGEWGQAQGSVEPGGSKPRVLLMDFGLKSNIARNLIELGCDVQIVPHTTSAQEIREQALSGKAQGLFLSNGPGDPQAVEETVAMLKELVHDAQLNDFPIYGICLGHQLLSLAIGAHTYKLPFGHRGANHPVHDLEMNRIQITSQNHGFAVDEESMIKAGGVITHLHLNDGTVAGFRHATKPIAAVQFHPESSPGPHDASIFFQSFLELITSHSRHPEPR
jgi:carbamoyl-phosphate synthase small subunit